MDLTSGKADKIARLLFFFSITVLVVYTVSGATFRFDAGYYLTLSRWIAEGYRPYIDFKLHYTYNFIYLNALFFKIFTDPPPPLFFLLHWAVLLVNMFLVYRIVNGIVQIRAISYFLSLSYLLIHLGYGFDIVLEALTSLFTLWSAHLLINKKPGFLNFFFAGLLAAEAFFTKQYGVGSILCMGIFMLYKMAMDKRILLGVAGFSGVLVAFLLNVVLLQLMDVPVGLFLNEIQGSGYGQRSVSLFMYETFNYALKTGTVVFIIFALIHARSRNIRAPETGIFYFLVLPGLFLFSLQFYFAQFDHYKQLLVPFTVLLFAVVYRMYLNNRFLTLFLTLFLSFILLNSLFEFVRYSLYWNKPSEKATAEYIKRISGNRPVYLFTDPKYYFLSDLETVNKREIGISVPSILTPEQITEIGHSADLLIFDDTELKKYEYLLAGRKIHRYKTLLIAER